MKFTCDKQLLQNAVNAASRAASARSSIPALEGLLIQAGANVRVTGYDLRKGIYQSIEADFEEPGSARPQRPPAAGRPNPRRLHSAA